MFTMIRNMKVLAVAAIAATGLAAGVQTASAHDNFSFGLSFGVPVYTTPAPVYTPTPVYTPAPVYVPACRAPAPTVVYAQPAPVVVYAPAPVYYRPYYGWDHRGWDHREWHR
ncbi:MAG TPA: hypothetical protein VM008_22340 [Phycisphaerae bacterium]|nr:hypothetical protein [Phycisphaerae bacterium]